MPVGTLCGIVTQETAIIKVCWVYCGSGH